jgi:hypothetical protein
MAGEPTLLIAGGYTFRFRLADCEERAHVHVTGARGSAKVWLAPVGLARSRAYNHHVLNEIVEISRTHQREWLRRWHEVCG